MNSDDCIVTQVHIPDYDVQGNMYREDKIELVKLSLKHLRDANKHSYIILTGHGHFSDYFTKACDMVIWEPKCRPLKPDGFVEGMPAQYTFVSRGIKTAKQMRFKRVAKVRTDCIYQIDNLCRWCDNIIREEDKQLLITQQTSWSSYRLGDCFMYGDIDIIDKMWDLYAPPLHNDGLIHIGIRFLGAVNNGNVPIIFDQELWLKKLKETCSFIDVTELECIDLRRHWPEVRQMLRDGTRIDVDKYHWGKKLGWHTFDKDGNMTGNARDYFCRKTFYK